MTIQLGEPWDHSHGIDEQQSQWASAKVGTLCDEQVAPCGAKL